MIITFRKKIGFTSYAAVGGKAEKEGPLGHLFDEIDESDKFMQKTWEMAEGEMQHRALKRAMNKIGCRDDEIGMMFAGDLMNQCTSSSYGLLNFDIPMVGLYGACSTAAESIALAALSVEVSGGMMAAVTSSHFCSAERQFRFPLEYGGQRTPTAQRTVTGAAAFLLGETMAPLTVSSVMFGRSVDSGLSDLANMGAAMAPAAADTLCRFFKKSGTRPDEYTKIVTGDLGMEGYRILKILMAQKGYPIDRVYDDCGLMIYHNDLQDTHAGGSGCGCSATVAAIKLLPELAEEGGSLLFVGTGALMSPTSVQQGLSIVGIAHLVKIDSKGGGER